MCVFAIEDWMLGTHNLQLMGDFIPEAVGILFWLVCRKVSPNHTPYFDFVNVGLSMAFVALGFWGILPESIIAVVPHIQDKFIFDFLLYFTFVNYNTHMATLLIAPALFCVPFYFQLVKQVEMLAYDPYTGESIAKDSYILEWFLDLVFLLMCSLLHHYLVQRDLAICVID